MVHGYKKEDIEKDLKWLERNIDLGYIDGYDPWMETNEYNSYFNYTLPMLLREQSEGEIDLAGYDYLPEGIKTSKYIIGVCWDIMSNRNTSDEKRNWLQDAINEEIDKCYSRFKTKQEEDSNKDYEDSKVKFYETYIPYEVETGIYENKNNKKQHINRYRKEVKRLLDKYYIGLSDDIARSHDKSVGKYVESIQTHEHIYYNKLVRNAILLLVVDLKFYDYFPSFLQKDEKVAFAYATIINTTYADYMSYVKVAEQYYKEVDKCWKQYNRIQKEENKYPKKYLTYIPDEVETGITEDTKGNSRNRS